MAKKKSSSTSSLSKEDILLAYMKADSLAGKNMFYSGMSNDLHKLFTKDEKFLMARNAVLQSPIGDTYSLSNEMSNRLVAKAPYTIIGCVFINNGQWAIFSTDDTNCEIGIFDENTNKYEGYVNSKELGFKKSHLIKGVGRIKQYSHRCIYWDDDLNPSRYMDFEDIKWKGKWIGEPCMTFEKEIDTECNYQDPDNHNFDYSVLDVRKLLLTPNTYTGLSFELNKGYSDGDIVNGTYVVFGYYSHGGASNPITNFFTLSNPQSIFTHNNMGGSLEIIVKDVDTTFEEFSLGIVVYEQMNHSFYSLGTYSTNTNKIFISHIDQKLGQFPFESIFKELEFPEKSAGIYKISDFLLRIKPTEHQDFNYQPLANQIKTYWVEVEYDQDYYKNGGHNVGYMRDEVYSFFIRFVYDTGDKSKSYHIPGRDLSEYQTEKAGVLDKNSDIYKKIKSIKLSDNGKIRNAGYMQYWSSTENYDDKHPDVWTNLCGQKIRHHKMPNNETSKHFGFDYSDNNNNTIKVLSVYFDNIQKPTKKVKNDKGEWIDVEIDNIIGYEILRGSREGNKTIVAKGILNNMRSYKTKTADGSEYDTVYYQNYPYNSTQDDLFITRKMLQYSNKKKGAEGRKSFTKRNNGEDEIYYESNKFISNDLFSFHSPELTYSKEEMKSAYFLNANKIVTYGKLTGTVDQLEFFMPKGTPRQKLMKAPALITSIVFGLGNGLLKMDGVHETTITAPMIDSGGTTAGVFAGVVEGTVSQGNAGVSFLEQELQNAGAISEEAVRKLWTKIKESIAISAKAGGTDLQQVISNAEIASGLTAGSLSGKGATITTKMENTGWSNIPRLFRVLNGVPIFMTSWGNGIKDVMEMIYSFGKYRNYTLQQTSHGFYNTWTQMSKIEHNNEYDIKFSSYLSDSTITLLPDNSKINNVYRPQSVAVKLDKVINERITDSSQVLYSDYITNGKTVPNIQSIYASMKQDNPAQYGQIQNIYQILATFKTEKIDEPCLVFGGDTYISRYTEKNNMVFFSDWLNGQPDGYEFDYSQYQMVFHPRFWMNTARYDISSITDSLAELIKTSNVSDFDPFALTNRFDDDVVTLKNDTYDNPETVFDIDVATSSEQSFTHFKEFYPKEIVNKYIEDISKYKTLNKELNDIKINLSNAESSEDPSLIEKLQFDYDTKKDEVDELKNTIQSEFNKSLSVYNNQRRCTCTFNDLSKHVSEFYFDERVQYFIEGKEIKVDDKIIKLNTDNIDDYELLFDRDTWNTYLKDKASTVDDYIYLRDNKLSLINCAYFKYGTNEYKADNTSLYLKDVISYSGETEASKTTGKLWYEKPYTIPQKTYKSLCELKKKLAEEKLKLAIASGYVHYLQEVEEHTGGNYEYPVGCWAKHISWYYDEDKEFSAVDNFVNPWSDDYYITESDYSDRGEEDEKGMQNVKKGKGYWFGFAEGGIPYTRNPKLFNPLLVYFIQQETDIKLRYISKEEFENNWNEFGLVKGNTYHGYPNIETYSSDDQNWEPIGVTKYFPVNVKDVSLTDEIKETSWKEIFQAFPEWGKAWNMIIDEDDETYGINDEFKPMSYMEALNYLESNGQKEVNNVFNIYEKLSTISYDTLYASNYKKYWTINGVMDIFGLKSTRSIKKKKLSFNYRYMDTSKGVQVSDDTVTVYKELSCKNLNKFFEKQKGKLKRRIDKLNDAIESASKKYTKEIQKLNNAYNEKLQEDDDTSMLKNIKTAINSLTPGSDYALDGLGYSYSSIGNKVVFNNKYGFFIKDMYMYTFVSGVRDFFVESTKNIGYRDWIDEPKGRHYDRVYYNDLKELFDTNIIKESEKFIFSKSLVANNLLYNAGFLNLFNKVQNNIYDPIEAAENLQRFNTRLLYSNKDEDTQITDGWRVFKTNNRHDFDDEITSCLATSEHGAVVLFKNSSPVVFVDKVDITPSMSKTEVSVGTGALFSPNNMKHLSSFDSFEAASCQDSFSAINTPIGPFYIGQEQGKIFTFQKETPVNIAYSSQISKWLSLFMPYMLTRDLKVNEKVFSDKEFELTDNPVAGIGCQTSYDTATSLIYFSKKDYKIKDEYIERLMLDDVKYGIKYLGNGLFEFHNKLGLRIEVKLGDSNYFDNASFTLSYDMLKDKTWVSFHDWHPDLTMNSKDRIYSTKDNGIWRHNDSTQSYCSFYGNDYPFEVEFSTDSDGSVATLRNIKYMLETYTYSDNGYDRYHTLFDNFDRAIIYNTEQISGQLNLIHQENDKPEMIIEYPKIYDDHIDILWSKEEQMYRFDQFWDITNDRMENDTMFITAPDGYNRKINPNFVNYYKDEFERKKFRHFTNTVRLTRTISGNVNYIFTVDLNNNQKSYR